MDRQARDRAVPDHGGGAGNHHRSRATWAPTGSLVVPLYGDEHGPSVIEMTVGRGRAMWWEAATPLTNGGITVSNNLAFVLASLGAPGERRILWNEDFHGRRRTLAASIWHSPTRWIGLQMAIVCLVVLLTNARRSGPIMLPGDRVAISPLEFVRTLGRSTRVPARRQWRWRRHNARAPWLARRLGVARSRQNGVRVRAGGRAAASVATRSAPAKPGHARHLRRARRSVV